MDRLNKLRIEVENTFGVSLANKCRTKRFAEARSVFGVVARRLGYKYKQIGEVTGRTHPTVISSIKQHRYLGDGIQNITNRIYEAVLTNEEAITVMAKRMEQMDYLTENEKAYRRLTAHQKAVYDERVSAILKMI